LIGDFKNAGQEWKPKGKPETVRVHDFEDKELGKGIPYGIYDTGRNEGWVSVGVDHDTAQFAVSSIRNWWLHMGQKVYPHARELLITADAGGSNGYRVKLWKRELQKLANDIGLRLVICHFPPGTSNGESIVMRSVPLASPANASVEDFLLRIKVAPRSTAISSAMAWKRPDGLVGSDRRRDVMSSAPRRSAKSDKPHRPRTQQDSTVLPSAELLCRRSYSWVLPERMNSSHSSLEPFNEGSPLLLLSATLSA
jgi:hypothetical protein